MAKAKVKKTAKRAVSKNKAALVGLGIVLVCVRIMLFALQSNEEVVPAVSGNLPQENEQAEKPSSLGPSQGCRLVGANYLCDIKVTNPKAEPLEWSSIITGLEGASIVEGNSGTVAPNGATMVKLSVPKSLCDDNPEANETVVILEDTESSNQGEAAFNCSPEVEASQK